MHMDHLVFRAHSGGGGGGGGGGRGLLAVDGGGNALSCLRHLSSCMHSRVRIYYSVYTHACNILCVMYILCILQ